MLRQDYKRAAFRQASALASLGYGGYRATRSTPRVPTVKLEKLAYSRRIYKKKPRKFAKSNAKLTQQMTTARKAIHDLKLSEDASLGHMTFRRKDPINIDAPQNEQKAIVIDGSSKTLVEASLAFLRYYDPSTPGTLIIADATTGTFSKKVLFKSLTSSLAVRNNGVGDTSYTVYLCRPKDDTNQTVIDAWTAGLLDQSYDDGGTALDITSTMTYPSDFALVKALWHVKRVCTKRLQPGTQFSVSHTEKDMIYNPAVADTHALEYQKEYKAFQWVVVATGGIAQDTTTGTNIGYAHSSNTAIIRDLSYKVDYNAGINLTYCVADDNLLAMVANVTSNKPSVSRQNPG